MNLDAWTRTIDALPGPSQIVVGVRLMKSGHVFRLGLMRLIGLNFYGICDNKLKRPTHWRKCTGDPRPPKPNDME